MCSKEKDFAPYKTRVFDIQYSNWHKTISVHDGLSPQPLYTLTGSECRNCYTITSFSTNQVIGTTKISSMTSKIVVETTSGKTGVTNNFEISNDKFWAIGSPRFTSPAFGGQTMTWKNKAMAKAIVYTLVGEKGVGLAKFESNYKTQTGKLEVTGDVEAAGEDAMNEVMVVLLTLLKRKLIAIETATIAAVGSA